MHSIVGYFRTNERNEVTECRLTVRDITTMDSREFSAEGPDALITCAEKAKTAIRAMDNAAQDARDIFGGVAA